MPKDYKSLTKKKSSKKESFILLRTEFPNEAIAQPVAFLKKLNRFIHLRETNTYSIRLPLDSDFYRALKRCIDIIVSTFVIVFILTWLIPIIGIIIKLDSKGPVFFLQKRNKKNGGLFTCVKFRSMVVNTTADLVPASENDRRITSVGRFLRDNYLDEFPQFFNVLSGDMSLIGPRPYMISDNLRYQELVEHYSYRYKVKPGITGLAQVFGSVGSINDTGKICERINLDIFYIRYWSLILDTKIIFRTVCKMTGF